MLEHIINLTESIGDQVLCDICSKDYTDSEEQGGFLRGSYAICPECADSHYINLVKFDETEHIKSWCKKDESFRDFVYRLRGD